MNTEQRLKDLAEKFRMADNCVSHPDRYRPLAQITLDEMSQLQEINLQLSKKVFELEKKARQANTEEHILCAALMFRGEIVVGHRHSDCYRVIMNLVLARKGEDLPDREAQGFLTSHARFVEVTIYNFTLGSANIKENKEYLK